MSAAPDLLLQSTLASWVAKLKERPDLIDGIFRGLDTATIASIKTYVTDVDTEIRLGWTQHSGKLPIIAVVAPGEQEQAQFIGSDPGDYRDPDTGQFLPASYVNGDTFLEAQATQFAGSVDAAIYALNPTETTWLTTIVRWVLLMSRSSLEDQGLLEQRLSVTDFMPSSDYPQPDQVYTRVVKLGFVNYISYYPEHTDPDDLLQADRSIVINTKDQ